jgi:hypothetical protein
MKHRGTVTKVIYAEQEKVEEKVEKPKFTGIGKTLGDGNANARDILGSKEYGFDQKCQKKTEKEQCIAPCVWNESQEPQCRYENVIQKISEVTANIAVDNDAFTSLEVTWIKDENFIEKKKILKKARRSLFLSLFMDEDSANMFDKQKIEKQISDNILSDLTLKMPPAASLYSSPKSSVAAASPKSSPKSAAASPKSSVAAASPKSAAASLEYKDLASFHNGQAISTGFPIGNTRQSVSVATTSLLASAYSWFESGVDFFTRVREEKELSAEELEKLEKKEYDFYKQNIEWLYSDSIEIDRENAAAKAKKEKEIKEKMEEIAALQKKIEKEERDKKEKEKADRAEKEKEIKEEIAALQKKIEKKDADKAEKEKEEIAALQKKIEKEEIDKKKKEDAARAEKDAARAAAKAEEDAARAEEDAKYTAARNKQIKHIATSAWSAMGTMVAGAVDLTKGVINVGKEVGKEGIKVGKEGIKVGKKVGKYGIGMAFDGLNNLLDENNKRDAAARKAEAARDAAARKAARDADAKKPARNDTRKVVYMGESNQNHQTADSGDYGDSGDEVVFIGDNRNPKREATATLTRIPSAAASPPSPPPRVPTCEAIMDEEPCENTKEGQYFCNWMDRRRPQCKKSTRNTNEDAAKSFIDTTVVKQMTEQEVDNIINNPNSDVYRYWNMGPKSLKKRWVRDTRTHQGRPGNMDKIGHRGGNRKTKKRNNKRNNKK